MIEVLLVPRGYCHEWSWVKARRSLFAGECPSWVKPRHSIFAAERPECDPKRPLEPRGHRREPELEAIFAADAVGSCRPRISGSRVAALGIDLIDLTITEHNGRRLGAPGRAALPSFVASTWCGRTRSARERGLTAITGWFQPLYMKCHCDISHGVGETFPCKPSNPLWGQYRRTLARS